MTWILAPTFNFFHDLSAVYTGAFNATPSAKEARSPKGQAKRPGLRDETAHEPGVHSGSTAKSAGSVTQIDNEEPLPQPYIRFVGKWNWMWG